jgi:nucleotide-binding universal stress UspA family protein
MFDHIIVPIDLAHANPAHRALKVAKENLAPGGTLSLLHVVVPLPAYVRSELESYLDKASESARLEIAALVAQDELPPSTEIVVVQGSVHRKILEMVENTDHDAIVMASHNPKFTDFVIGSVAAQVVKHAKCSVFVVRHAD